VGTGAVMTGPRQEPIPVGTPAPDFTLRDQHGQDVSLSGLRGSPVMVFFYPWAFSRVCTGELSALRDVRRSVEDRGARLLAVSCDPVYSLRAFAEAERLDYPLLSDFWPHGAVASAYGVLDDTRGCPRRSSFLVDGDGVVRWSVHHEVSDPREVVAHLTALELAERRLGDG
jgi:mycoredoxin-dependent peroxiredoxin